jgi:hypothetical protein
VVLTPETALDLQRRAGNSAVATLLDRGTLAKRGRFRAAVQRDKLDPADDPHGYTKPGGKQVTGTGTTRVEVTGLKFGVKGGFAGSYGDAGPSVEKKMTKESPDNMAVVIMPDAMDAKRPVQVVLHFHGWGFRSTDDAQDPYAGYTVAAGGPTQSQGAKGTVRDVDQEHWEQQIGAVAQERAKASPTGPQIVAILA